MKPDPTLNELPMCDLLARFSRDDRRALSPYGTFLVLKANEVVIREGEPQNCLFFLVSGTLHALHKVQDGATPVGSIQAGEWFGEINIFDPQVASAEVVAHDKAQIWRISRAGLEEFLNANPVLGCQLLLTISELLSRRARKMMVKVNAIWDARL